MAEGGPAAGRLLLAPLHPSSPPGSSGTRAEAAVSRVEKRELGQPGWSCVQGSGQRVQLEQKPLLKSVHTWLWGQGLLRKGDLVWGLPTALSDRDIVGIRGVLDGS